MQRKAPAAAPESPVHDPILAWCGDVMALFAGPLGEVRFPDVDAPTLGAAADELRAAQLEIEALERALDDARARARDRGDAFAELCRRALAYARVFASAQPELRAALDDVRMPVEAAAHGPAPRKRGRPRKDSVTVALLPDDAAAAQ